MRAHDCHGNEPTDDIRAMIEGELYRALVGEQSRDPWISDWETGHRGRQIKEELEHRRQARLDSYEARA